MASNDQAELRAESRYVVGKWRPNLQSDQQAVRSSAPALCWAHSCSIRTRSGDLSISCFSPALLLFGQSSYMKRSYPNSGFDAHFERNKSAQTISNISTPQKPFRTLQEKEVVYPSRETPSVSDETPTRNNLPKRTHQYRNSNIRLRWGTYHTHLSKNSPVMGRWRG